MVNVSTITLQTLWLKKEMTVHLTEQGLTWKMKLRWSRKIQEVNWLMFSGWTRWKVLSGIPLFMTPWWPLIWVIRMPPFIPWTWTSSCVTFSPFPVPHVLHIPCHVWLCTLNSGPGCSVHSCCKQPAYVTHDHHPIVHLSKMDGDHFGVPPALDTRGKMTLAPHWQRCWGI